MATLHAALGEDTEYYTQQATQFIIDFAQQGRGGLTWDQWLNSRYVHFHHQHMNGETLSVRDLGNLTRWDHPNKDISWWDSNMVDASLDVLTLQEDLADACINVQMVGSGLGDLLCRVGEQAASASGYEREQQLLEQKNLLIIPINDGYGKDTLALGTHWSLLFVDRRLGQQSACYVDSMTSSRRPSRNQRIAALVLQGLKSLIQLSEGPTLRVLHVPTQYRHNLFRGVGGQPDGGACGPYIPAFVEYILNNKYMWVGRGGLAAQFTESDLETHARNMGFDSLEQRCRTQNLIYQQRQLLDRQGSMISPPEFEPQVLTAVVHMLEFTVEDPLHPNTSDKSVRYRPQFALASASEVQAWSQLHRLTRNGKNLAMKRAYLETLFGNGFLKISSEEMEAYLKLSPITDLFDQDPPARKSPRWFLHRHFKSFIRNVLRKVHGDPMGVPWSPKFATMTQRALNAWYTTNKGLIDAITGNESRNTIGLRRAVLQDIFGKPWSDLSTHELSVFRGKFPTAIRPSNADVLAGTMHPVASVADLCAILEGKRRAYEVSLRLATARQTEIDVANLQSTVGTAAKAVKTDSESDDLEEFDNDEEEYFPEDALNRRWSSVNVVGSEYGPLDVEEKYRHAFQERGPRSIKRAATVQLSSATPSKKQK